MKYPLIFSNKFYTLELVGAAIYSVLPFMLFANGKFHCQC